MKGSIILLGALTSKPYAFKARSWELRSINTIDLFDSLGSNIRVDIRGSEIMRVLPINNEYINEEWISDKARHAYDGLSRDRFINPMIKQGGYFIQTTWENAFRFVQSKLLTKNYKNLVINTGNFLDFEAFSMLDLLAKRLYDKYNLSINAHYNRNVDFQENYTINPNLLNFTDKKVIILVGINLRLENPILNIKLKKLSNNNNVIIGYIGAKYDYNINLIHLGNNTKVLSDILSGKHNFCTTIANFNKTNTKNNKIIEKYKNKVTVLFGNDVIESGIDFSLLIKKTNVNANIFEYGFLENYTGKINAFEIGFFNNIVIPKNVEKIFYLINTETVVGKNKNDLVIFQGHHNTKNRVDFDLILPSLVWTEKSGLFMNSFGFIQKTQVAVSPPVNCRNDWKITQILLETLNSEESDLSKQTSAKFLDFLHYELNHLSPNIMNAISIYNNAIRSCLKIDYSKMKLLLNTNKHNNMPIKGYISDYYKITSIEKASKVMNICSSAFSQVKSNFLK